MSLKLYQDHFTSIEETEEPAVLYEAISNYRTSLLICHESDPAWRRAVLSSRDTLLTLRHMVDEAHREHCGRSVQPQGQRPPVTSRSSSILDSQHGSGSGFSNSQLSFNTSSIASVFSQVPRLSTTGPLASATDQHCSSQVSSSSSTLSLLFGKRSFSSGLVILGLSAAEGGTPAIRSPQVLSTLS